MFRFLDTSIALCFGSLVDAFLSVPAAGGNLSIVPSSGFSPLSSPGLFLFFTIMFLLQVRSCEQGAGDGLADCFGLSSFRSIWKSRAGLGCNCLAGFLEYPSPRRTSRYTTQLIEALTVNWVSGFRPGMALPSLCFGVRIRINIPQIVTDDFFRPFLGEEEGIFRRRSEPPATGTPTRCG